MFGNERPWQVTSSPEGTAKAVAKKQFFTTGQHILTSGIYRVKHSEHRLPNEVTLLKGQEFPRCEKCGDRVLFELLHAAPYVFADPDFKVVLYELPELRPVDDDEEDLKKVI